MAEYDANQAHPKIDYQGTYPNLHVTQRADGSQEIRSLEPGKESFFNIQPSGNYEGHGPNGEQVSVTVGKKHDYSGDGTSQTTDGHSDTKVSGGSRSSTDGGSHSETGGNQYSGGGGVSVNGNNDSQINSTVAGDSFATTEGNITTDHTGDMHHNVTGDYVEQITGNKIEMITGDYGINNQGGNYDLQVDGGKTRIFSGNDILIESGTKITIKVGSSTIVIDGSSITMKSAKINLN